MAETGGSSSLDKPFDKALFSSAANPNLILMDKLFYSKTIDVVDCGIEPKTGTEIMKHSRNIIISAKGIPITMSGKR